MTVKQIYEKSQILDSFIWFLKWPSLKLLQGHRSAHYVILNMTRCQPTGGGALALSNHSKEPRSRKGIMN